MQAEQSSSSEIQEELNVRVARKGQSQIILSTAQVLIEDAKGERHLCRALLDPGSQINVITKAIIDKMGHKAIKTSQSAESTMRELITQKWQEYVFDRYTQSLKQNLNALLCHLLRNHCRK